MRLRVPPFCPDAWNAGDSCLIQKDLHGLKEIV